MNKILTSLSFLLLSFLIIGKANAQAPGFTFAVISDARHQWPAPIFAEIAELNPVFVLQIGDICHNDPAPKKDWIGFYQNCLYDSPHGQNWQKYLAGFPIYHTWDDHDFGLDNSDGRHRWKTISKKAFAQYFPMPFANYEDGIYFSFTYENAEFFVLDARYSRIRGKTVLGPNQLQWLRNALLESDATWKFIITSVPWNPTVEKKDAWYGYLREREGLMKFIKQEAISSVIFISGDIHTGGAIDDGTNSGYPEVSVPHTNLILTSGSRPCTARFCGNWSEGFISRKNSEGGYALITVNGSSIIVSTHSTGGGLVLEIDLE